MSIDFVASLMACSSSAHAQLKYTDLPNPAFHLSARQIHHTMSKYRTDLGLAYTAQQVKHNNAHARMFQGLAFTSPVIKTN